MQGLFGEDESLPHLIEVWKESGPEVFAKTYGAPALLGLGLVSNAVEVEETTEQTAMVSFVALAAAMTLGALLDHSAVPGLGTKRGKCTGLVWWVAKRPSVTLGRADNNDIVVPHQSISTEQCRFESRDEEPTQISNMSTTNATWVAQRRLEAGQSATLHGGEVVALGSLQFRFLYPHDLARTVGELATDKPKGFFGRVLSKLKG